MTTFLRPSFFVTLMLCFSTLMLSACGGGPRLAPADQPSNADSAYLLGVGDLLRITVYGQEQITGEYSVDSNGEIALPLVQNIVAKGLTIGELQRKITRVLSPKYLKNPKVSVEILQYRDIYVLGEVRNPGKYPYVPNMTVLQAVAVAGGHTYRAQEEWAEITRNSKEGLQTFSAGAKSFIEPGDTVIVKRRWF